MLGTSQGSFDPATSKSGVRIAGRNGFADRMRISIALSGSNGAIERQLGLAKNSPTSSVPPKDAAAAKGDGKSDARFAIVPPALWPAMKRWFLSTPGAF